MNYSTSAHFYLDDAEPVQDRDGVTFIPTSGWWDTVYNTTSKYLTVRVVLCADNPDNPGQLRFTVFPADEAPAWVPRPAFGWDHNILAIAGAALWEVQR